MSDFSIATFNVKNLIGADAEYYRFESYTPEEYAWKEDWLADQLLSMDADIVCFQEIFDKDALVSVVEETNRRGQALNEAVVPDRSKRYARKAIFKKLAFAAYDPAQIAIAPNANDGAPGQRRPGLAVLSRLGFMGAPEIIQDLPEPLTIPFSDLGGEDGGSYTLRRTSRPILKVRIPLGDRTLTVFNCHLKSKLGEFPRTGDAPPPEIDLTRYDPAGRALGALRSALRRMAEAWVLRTEVLKSLDAGEPVMVLGDFNDAENAVSSEIIAGEKPFKNYAWMRRHDAKDRSDRYSDAENTAIRTAIEAVRLHSAEKLFVRKSLRDMVFTASFGGVFESIDQILMSRHFHPDNPDRIGEMAYFSALNDHLTDGSHPEAPYNKLASDHGQIIAHMTMRAL
ncbi:MAG: endonuclease/exonuclease/phosphatase family protein [Pseudomonadota bacterium]